MDLASPFEGVHASAGAGAAGDGDQVLGLHVEAPVGRPVVTLGERRIPEVHAWLLERFSA